MRLHFDERSTWLGGEVIEDPAEVVRHNYWRDATRHRSVAREELDDPRSRR